MTREFPDWQPFDPSAESVSTAATPPSPDESGRRVVMVVPTAAVEGGGWAARTTVALARTWGAEGTKVFLADLSVRRPVLHEVVGVENGEGISDALLYGASIQRIAVSTDEPFFFAPAGTVVPDAEPVLGHPRWEVLTQGFSSAGVTLLLYVPLDLPGTSSLLQRASEVILLATETEAATTEFEGVDGKVSLVLGPDGDLPVEPAHDEGALLAQIPAETPEEGEASVLEEPAAPVEEPAVAAEPAAAVEAAAVAAEPAAAPAVEEPATPGPAMGGRRSRKTRKKRSSRVSVLVLALVLVLGGAVVGAYYGYVDVPWLTPYLEQLDGGGEAAPGDAGSPTTSSASPEGEGPGDPSSIQP